ncbi:MAG: YihY/virulence factor BrkB family protein [Lachnospiraceae bacterium]
MIHLIIQCKRILDKYNEDEITVYAAQASFFIVLTFFPFIMVLLTIIQFIPSIGKSDLLSFLVAIMPDMLDSMMVGIVDDLYVKSPGTILSLSALLALWSAGRGMMGIERGLNRIYECQERRNYFIRRFICTIYTIVFMIVCVVSLVLLIFGNSIQNLIVQALPFLGNITHHVISFRSLLAMILCLICFTGLYTIIPKVKQDPWQQVPGAIFATICWLLFSYAFSIYFTSFSNYSYMYGSLAAIVVLMLWLYFCICILFVGAEINHLLAANSGIDR